MFLICYNLKYEEQPRLLWYLGRALLGPTAHVELSFVTDFKSDAFYVGGNSEEGLPEFDLDRTHWDHDGLYEFVWYELKAKYQEIYITRKKVEKIIANKKYHMDVRMMVGSTVPSRLATLFSWVSTMLFKMGHIAYKARRLSTFCVPLIALVLDDIYPRVPPESNCTDLIVHLTKHGLIKKVKSPIAPITEARKEAFKRSNPNGYI